ncbi:MAG: 2-C-methyl-D-erythritol 4-phosphate cytidylyltransferase [Ruminococcus sp.]|nr:2-C-methyl-D-erythritol 4-phosphate cytidylyltransferase [Ruminococcus sp.]
MIFAGIVAGGTGTRMGADIPKQFLKIGEKPIIIHTITKFLENKRIEKIYLGVHPEWIQYTQKIINEYNLDNSQISIVKGGIDRNSTVFNIIDLIVNEHGINDSDIILTHDGVRPFVTPEIINNNIETALKYGACGTYISAVDTIIRSQDGNIVSEVSPRQEMFQAQTPQSFNILKLKNAYKSLTESEKEKLTDTCSIFTMKGLPIHIVKGDVINMKITTSHDLKIADLIAKQI